MILGHVESDVENRNNSDEEEEIRDGSGSGESHLQRAITFQAPLFLGGRYH